MKNVIWDSEINNKPGMCAHNGSPKHGQFQKRAILITIFTTIVLFLSGCSADDVTYFSQNCQETQSASQTQNVNSNEQENQQSTAIDGYVIELKSLKSESNSFYVTFALTAPDDVDLSSVWDASSEERLIFRKLLAMQTSSNLPADLSYNIVDDGDNRNNTLNLILRIDPIVDQKNAAKDTYKITFSDIIKQGYNRAYEQELLSTKYFGQNDYLLEQEEASLVHPQTLLASGEWEFEVELETEGIQELELLRSPINTNVLVVRLGASEYETEDSIESITLTSVLLDSSGLTIAFEKPEPIEKFDCMYLNTAQFATIPGVEVSNNETIFVMMKDGTKIYFFQALGAKETAFLRANRSIALSEVVYLQLSDGTRLSIDDA